MRVNSMSKTAGWVGNSVDPDKTLRSRARRLIWGNTACPGPVWSSCYGYYGILEVLKAFCQTKTRQKVFAY